MEVVVAFIERGAGGRDGGEEKGRWADRVRWSLFGGPDGAVEGPRYAHLFYVSSFELVQRFGGKRTCQPSGRDFRFKRTRMMAMICQNMATVGRFERRRRVGANRRMSIRAMASSMLRPEGRKKC